jgi:hypothetical protein
MEQSCVQNGVHHDMRSNVDRESEETGGAAVDIMHSCCISI